MLIEYMKYQIYNQACVKSGAPGTDWELMAFNEKTPFRYPVAYIFC